MARITQVTDRIITSVGVQSAVVIAESTSDVLNYRSSGCLAPTMGCHASEPDEP